MTKPLVSLVIPVYRHPEWVRKAVDSALAQTWADLEIILVDDGSPDGSGALCDEYAEKDARVRAIHQKNGGVSSARNAGLAVSKGEYFTFLDSDDALEPEHIERLVHLMEREKADLASLAMIFYLDEERIKTEVKNEEKTVVLTPREALRSVHLEDDFNGYVMNKMYRTSVWKGIRFDPEIAIHEDMLFLWQGILKCKKIVLQKRYTYHYLTHSTSAMNRSYSEQYESCIRASLSMCALMREHFPEESSVADKTLLFAVLSVANKRAAAGVLDEKSYLSLKKTASKYHSAKAFSYIVGADNRVSYQIFRFSRIGFLLWKKIVLFLRKFM